MSIELTQLYTQPLKAFKEGQLANEHTQHPIYTTTSLKYASQMFHFELGTCKCTQTLSLKPTASLTSQS